MLVKLISALGMGGFMVVSLFFAARMRYRKPKPAGESTATVPALPLREALQNPDWKVRLNAIRALDASLDETLLPDLMRAINDDDPDVREAAAQVVKPFGSAAVDGLSQIVTGGKLESRTLAVNLLANIGDARAIPALIEALEDHSRHVRLPAVEALGKLGDNSAVAALAGTLAKEKDADVRKAVSRSLKQIGTPEALLALKSG